MTGVLVVDPLLKGDEWSGPGDGKGRRCARLRSESDAIEVVDDTREAGGDAKWLCSRPGVGKRGIHGSTVSRRFSEDGGWNIGFLARFGVNQPSWTC